MSVEVFRCEICNTTSNSLQQLLQHNTGRSHLRKLSTMKSPQDPDLTNVSGSAATLPGYGGRFIMSSHQTSSNGSDMQSFQDPVPYVNPECFDPVKKGVEDNMMGRLPPKTKVERVECKVCRIPFNSESQIQAHYSGAKHAKKLKSVDISKLMAYNNKNPVLTNVSASAATLPGFGGGHIMPDHQTSSNGSVMLSFQTAAQTVNPESHDPVKKAVEDNMKGRLPLKRKVEGIECEVCRISFNSESQIEAHYYGAKHAKKLKSIDISKKITSNNKSGEEEIQTIEQIGDTYACRYCDLQVNSLMQFEAHLKGRKHKNKVKMSTNPTFELRDTVYSKP